MNYISTLSNGSLGGLLRDFDTLTSRVFGDMDRPAGFPRVDVSENEKEYILEAELAGYSDKDVDVRVKDGLLTIASVPREEKKGAEVQYLIRERRDYGFERSFKLPKDADQENISAVFKNGILTLSIGRKPETQPRTIAIRSE